MRCPECKSKFNFVGRIKSINNKSGEIQCLNCKNTFVKEAKSGRLISSLGFGIIVFINIYIGSSLVYRYFESVILGALMIGVATGVMLFIFLFIAQNWWKYKKI